MNDTVQSIINLGRAQVGGPYRRWRPWSDWNSTQYIDPAIIPDDLLSVGGNCTSSYNWLLLKLGLRDWGIGGTTDFCSSSQLTTWEPFNIYKNYPPGTFLCSPYTSDDSQGHVAMVTTFEDASHIQYLLQSHAFDGFTNEDYGTPGITESWDMSSTQQALGTYNVGQFVWAGLLSDVPVLDGFPGYTAPGKDIALWTAKVCEWYGIPRFYVATMILTEIRDAVAQERAYEDIREIPGYSYAVDHNSFGPRQGRWGGDADYFPFPWDYETGVYTFLQDVYTLHGANAPDDSRGAAEAIQAAQRSFADGSDGKPVGWNYEANYEEALDLVKDESAETAGTTATPTTVSTADSSGTAAPGTADGAVPTPDYDRPNYFSVNAQGIPVLGGDDWTNGWLWMDPKKLKAGMRTEAIYIPEFGSR